ncbi:hypothetical protein B0T25DRAFT_131253 [Lasiosphaeria hispida]|uniref:Uncharacterized protein n=1 Tax=Lasiosphaeria hispida TaxID=260671 RepID=A0AAJ0HSM6_9PEZI|nr:hypothetical protein B0T25DRAFT_131253 [Lasiosphaeria hispida]
MYNTQGDSKPELEDSVLPLTGRPITPPQYSTKSRRPIVLSCLLSSIFWWLFFSYQSDIWEQKPATKTLHCGNSTAEARARGCVFDPLATLWVPKPCYDEETNLAYRTSVDWYGYNDPNGTEMISVDEMSERVSPKFYYTTTREHAVHCAYMWQKQHLGYLRGGLYLDDYSASFDHTRHCAEMLIKTTDQDPRELSLYTAKTRVSFTSCEVEVDK